MKWFTQAWHAGDLSDDDYAAAVVSYNEHLATLRSAEGSAVTPLLDLNLHDARVRSWRHQDGVFAWCLLAGDLQRGYQEVTISYSQAELTIDLAAIAFAAEEVEVMSDEIEIMGDERGEHRLFFWPTLEFQVRFTAVTIETAPVDRR